MSTNSNYTKINWKLSEKEAIALLELLHEDLLTTQQKIERAIVWAHDIQGLPFTLINSAFGKETKKGEWSRTNYHQTKKGGENS